MSDLVASLWITLIGMGLVFIGILMLWGLMEAVVRITARFATNESEEEAAESSDETLPAGEEAALAAPAASQKRQAAAVAVTIALALRKPAARLSLPLERTLASSSAWQTVTRASQLNHPTQIARKSRGSVR